MNQPEVQNQMQEMATMMANPAFVQKLGELRASNSGATAAIQRWWLDDAHSSEKAACRLDNHAAMISDASHFHFCSCSHNCLFVLLQEDPELKPMFDEIKTGGMAAMMKYMNDPVFLAKIGEKMQGVLPAEAAGPSTAAAAAPEITNILDAAKSVCAAHKKLDG